MEHSRNIDGEPIGKKRVEQARRVSLIIAGMTQRFTGEPFPAMSDHYQPAQHDVPDVQEGFDEDGNFHRLQGYSESADIVIERTEQAQLPFTGGGRWDDQGNYTT